MGGKKKTGTSKVGAVSTPNVQAGAAQPNVGAQVPNGVDTTTQNAQPAQPAAQGTPATAAQPAAENPAGGVQFVNSNPDAAKPAAQNKPHHAGGNAGKKSISEVIHKLHDELAELKERSTKLVTDVNEVQNNVTEMGHRVDSLEESKKTNDEKMAEMEENMTKFLSLYELINNQYNPFIDKESVGKVEHSHTMASLSDGSTATNSESLGHSKDSPFSKPDIKVDLNKSKMSSNELDSVLLELDTLNIEEAAGDAVPLTQLKNNTNSLVVILSWLEYMIKKVGIDETRNSLRYYTEVLRWITPEVFFDLDKYLRGMKDKKIDGEADTLGVKDHIVSLYFISKLNEKKLDEKLTNAVLQIIKD